MKTLPFALVRLGERYCSFLEQSGRRMGWLVGLMLGLSGCFYSQGPVVVDTAQGPLQVTSTSFSHTQRVRKRKDIRLPAAVPQQVLLYRQRHGFFPLTLSSLSADSDEGRAAVAALRAAGFTEAEFVGGGRPDSLALEFIFSNTVQTVETETRRSADFVTYNQVATRTSRPVEAGFYYGRFFFWLRPNGELAVVKAAPLRH